MGTATGSAYNFCLRELLYYVAGMLCFGCDPNWAAYFYTRSGEGRVGISLAPNACKLLSPRGDGHRSGRSTQRGRTGC